MGQASDTPAGNDFAQVAAGGYIIPWLSKQMVLIVSWGWDNFWRATVTIGNDFVQVAAGEYILCGSQSRWFNRKLGWDNYGQGIRQTQAGNDFWRFEEDDIHRCYISKLENLYISILRPTCFC